MEPRLSLVTLGVADVARARAFDEWLGFRASSASGAEVAFFRAGGTVLALWGRDALAADVGIPRAAGGSAGIALAHNVAARHRVAEVVGEGAAAGGSVLKPPADTVWGGHAAYVADPDGHLWEIVWNPHWPLRSERTLDLPP